MYFVFNAIYLYTDVSLHSDDGPRVSSGCIDNEIHLAVQMFDQNAGYSDPCARHQFVMMPVADLIMLSLNDCYVGDEDLTGTLLEKMSETVTISLKEGYENCGCYHTLPWLNSMLSLSSSVRRLRRLTVYMRSQPLWSLLDVLEKTLPASDDEHLEEGADEVNIGWKLSTN